MRSLQATPPFVKGSRGDLKLGEVRTTPSRGRGKISPHPSLSKRGVQATWQIRIGEVHPRSYPATSSFSTTFATDPEIAQYQRVHFCAQEAIQSLFRFADNRLIFIKRRIEHHRHAGFLPEGIYQPVISGIGMPVNSLQPA